VTRHACCETWKCCEQILSSGMFLFVSFIVQEPEGVALKHGWAWMLSAFGHFSCCLVWFEMKPELHDSIVLLFRMQTDSRSASQADLCPAMVTPFSSWCPLLSCSW